VVQAKLETVQSLYDELDTLHRRSFGKAPPLFAGVMVTGARLHLGHIADANDRFAKSIAVHDLDQLQRLQEAQGVNYMVLGRAWHAHALWCLGYPASARGLGRDAVQLARDLAQPFNQALAATYLAMLMQMCADAATARVRAEDALALATTSKAPYYRAWSTILVEYAHARDQPDAEHIGRLRAAITIFMAAGARLRLPYFLALLAQVCGQAGHTDDGLTIIDEALAAAEAQNEHWWDAELHRLRGELLLAHGAEASAVEAALLRAVEIARAQQARSLELRAAIPLARLWAVMQRADEGRRLLGSLCAWFTEGSELPDIMAARSLLAQLV
jgi:predicted ATPase